METSTSSTKRTRTHNVCCYCTSTWLCNIHSDTIASLNENVRQCNLDNTPTKAPTNHKFHTCEKERVGGLIDFWNLSPAFDI
eukprot:m.81132 g.81132  ORF g.81132 m.81132 type:complete len:82 (-) comp25388_c0_seq1:54-299(-)